MSDTNIKEISKNGSSYLGIGSDKYFYVKGSNLNGCLGFPKDVKVLPDWTLINIQVKDYFSRNDLTIVQTLKDEFLFCGVYYTINNYKKHKFGFTKFKPKEKDLSKLISKDIVCLKGDKEYILKPKGEVIEASIY